VADPVPRGAAGTAPVVRRGGGRRVAARITDRHGRPELLRGHPARSPRVAAVPGPGAPWRSMTERKPRGMSFETWIDNQSISWVIEAYRSQATSLTDPKVQPKLSKKELAIISCITRGMRNKEIAARLNVSERTVNFHLANIYQKLNVSGRTEALSKALEQGLITA